MSERKVKLTISEQIEHMKTQGIKFNIINEEQAKKYILQNTYYFRIKAYAKNYNKNKQDKYVGLEFAYLKELSILDMKFRRLILSMCLQVEHFLKVKINAHFNNNVSEDGYSIIEDFKKSNFALKTNDFLKKPKSHYNEDLINKYENNYALWNVLEVLSFGETIEFFKLYFDKYGENEKKLYGYLYNTKQLRNACAHNNCIINNVNKEIVPRKELYNFLQKNTDYSLHVINNKIRKVIINDYLSLIICCREIINSRSVQENLKVEADVFLKRIDKNMNYFKTNAELFSFLIFTKDLTEKLLKWD